MEDVKVEAELGGGHGSHLGFGDGVNVGKPEDFGDGDLDRVLGSHVPVHIAHRGRGREREREGVQCLHHTNILA